jgi:hypothetical protein
MDSRPDPGGLKQTYRLLALCARAEPHPVFYDQLRVRLAAFRHWDDLPAQAELLGMAPLFWHHVHAAKIALPEDTERTLHALYLRQRLLNQAHLQVLLQIIPLFQGAGIRALLLKGLALAHQYYPDPALRPVSDIDFLLPRADVLPALDVLTAAGFRVDSPVHATAGLFPRELAADSPPKDGLRTHVELHHYHPPRATPYHDARADELSGLDASPQALTIGEGVVNVPAPIDTLIYLSRHLRRHLFESTDRRPLSLKWTADMVSLVEKHAAEWDWAALQRHHPDLLGRLEVFYSLTPMPDRFVGLIPIRPPSPLRGPNLYPQAWPQHAWSDRKKVGLVRFLLQTFAPPSDWWLRLYYGIRARSTSWRGQVVHRLLIVKLVRTALLRKTRGAARAA